MIQITPYYSHPRKEDILNLYLSIVADVVPFYPEDVLNGHPRKTKGPKAAFRRRTDLYNKKLNDYKIKSVLNDTAEKRKNDALLAEAIIASYSATLHDKLYTGYKDGHVDPDHLQELLTVRMDGGELKEDFEFDDKSKSGSQVSKDMLEYVFRYEAFSKHEKLYELIGMLGVEVCPYCNRQFITTYAPSKNGSGKSMTTSKARPQLDHFKVKTEHPHLALSINNLIPCCGVCNHMKGDRGATTLYPYSEGMGDTYKFKTTIPGHNLLIAQVLTGAPIAPEHFDIALDYAGNSVDKDFRKRVEASKNIFALEGLYQSHKGYVSDMYFHRYIITEKMIDSIMDQFGELFESRDAVRQALMLADTSPDTLGKRPLAKLTKDIKEEIEEYYARIQLS